MNARQAVLVLSGGGVKAAAHIGAWVALAEAGVGVRQVIGTSMGAIVGCALAAGRTPEDLAGDVTTLRRRDVASLNPISLLAGIRARSVLRAGPLRSLIERLVPARAFSEFTLPVTVTATDLDSGERILYGAGGEDAPVVDALYASAALPFYYPPTVIRGRRVGDGGIRGVLPIGVARSLPTELVVAVDVGPGFEERSQPPPRHVPGLMRAHGDAIGILMAQHTRYALERWQADGDAPELVYVRPRVDRGTTFELQHIAEYQQRGYQATAVALGRLAQG